MLFALGESMARSRALRDYPLLLEAELSRLDLSLTEEDVGQVLTLVMDATMATDRLAAAEDAEFRRVADARRRR